MTTLANLEKKVCSTNLISHIEANLIENYEDFIQWTHNKIIIAIGHIEAKRDLFCSANEEMITSMIDAIIKSSESVALNHITSNTEGHASGHCDLNISWGEYHWHGEAKIYKGPAYIYEGYRQLTERYYAGTSSYNYAGILIYFQEPMIKKLTGYKNLLLEKKDDAQIEEDIITGRPLYFNVKDNHPSTGLPMNIVHFPVNLDHQSREHQEAKKIVTLREQARQLNEEADRLELKSNPQ